MFVVIGDSWWQLITGALLGAARAEFGFLVSVRNAATMGWVELSDQLGTAAGQQPEPPAPVRWQRDLQRTVSGDR